MFIDPIPDPIAAGWAKEGDQSHASSATSLRINDVNNTGFARFYVQDSSAFTSDIELNPSVLLAEGFTVDAENRTGVHVAINDGAREVRADILQIGARMVTRGLLSPAGPTVRAYSTFSFRIVSECAGKVYPNASSSTAT